MVCCVAESDVEPNLNLTRTTLIWPARGSWPEVNKQVSSSIINKSRYFQKKLKKQIKVEVISNEVFCHFFSSSSTLKHLLKGRSIKLFCASPPRFCQALNRVEMEKRQLLWEFSNRLSSASFQILPPSFPSETLGLPRKEVFFKKNCFLFIHPRKHYRPFKHYSKFSPSQSTGALKEFTWTGNLLVFSRWISQIIPTFKASRNQLSEKDPSKQSENAVFLLETSTSDHHSRLKEIWYRESPTTTFLLIYNYFYRKYAQQIEKKNLF